MKKVWLIITLLLGVMLVISVFYMPTQIGPLTYTEATETYINDSLSQTGATNIIAAIITDFRAFDTLGETLVLFTSILAVISVLSGVKKEDHHG